MESLTITLLCVVFCAFVSAISVRHNRLNTRIDRLERRINLVLRQMGIDTTPQLSDRVKDLARHGQKIQAIKAYRGETGSGLREAKNAVEDWMACERE